MKKGVMFWVKVMVLAAVAVLVGRALWKNWQAVQAKNISVNWWWGIVAVAGFCASMTNGALVWRWLAWKMGDRSPTPRLVGAYTFSQMGKYIPGKVALLLMRIDRAGRFGMSGKIATLSTLLENALYMISGGVVGVIAIVKVAGELEGKLRVVVWTGTVGALVVLALACYPPVFFGLVNRLLVKMKREPVGREAWLGEATLVAAVVGFVPCWIFGGVAMWASAMAVQGISPWESWWFAGAFALSVIVGMASLLPGGAGVREAVLGVALMLQFQAAGVGHAQAVLLAGAAAVLQRLFQVIAEIVMGAVGATLTAGEKPASTGDAINHRDAEGTEPHRG